MGLRVGFLGQRICVLLCSILVLLALLFYSVEDVDGWKIHFLIYYKLLLLLLGFDLLGKKGGC